MKLWIVLGCSLVGVVLIGMLAARTMAWPAIDIDADISERDYHVGALPDQRSFRMGFTNQPFAWSNAAFEETSRLIGRHGDFITIFEDVGVPWREAFEGTPYHPNVEKKIKRNLAAIQPHQTVAVVASALGIDRVSLAGYAGVTEPMDRPGPWAERDFDSPEVFEAYLKYANDLIARFQPDYFFYLAEANAAYTDVSSKAFQSMKRFAEKTYTVLKTAHPTTKFGIEFMLANTAYMAKRKAVSDALLPFTDVYAVSTYPFHEPAVYGDARNIPDDWFSQIKNYAGSKPFAVLETSFAAENFMHPTQGIRIQGQRDRMLIPGGAKSQAIFVKKLLNAAQSLNAEFVNLWAVKDTDALHKLIAGNGTFADPMWRLPQDSGLIDQNDMVRPAMTVWRTWLTLPHLTRD